MSKRPNSKEFRPDAPVGGVVLPFPQKKRLKPEHSAAISPQQLRNNLPFFSARAASHSWWSVKPTYKFQDDRITGAKYAESILPLMRYVGGPPALGWILDDMLTVVHRRRKDAGRRNKLSGIEIGFMNGLGHLIAAGIAATVFVARDGLFEEITEAPGSAERIIASFAARDRDKAGE